MIYHMPLDSQGRAHGAVCLSYAGFNYMNDKGTGLAKDVPQTNLLGSSAPWPQTAPDFWDSLPPGSWFRTGLDHGHLIGRQLGGDGNDRRNLVPLSRDVNQKVMRADENQTAGAIDAGDTVYMTVTPQYSGDNPIPTSIDTMAITSEGGPIVDSDISNVHRRAR